MLSKNQLKATNNHSPHVGQSKNLFANFKRKSILKICW